MSAAEIARGAKARSRGSSCPTTGARTRRFAPTRAAAHRSAPQFSRLAQRRRRDRSGRFARAAANGRRRSSRSATFPARWRNIRGCSCISCMRSARRGGCTTFLFGTRLTNVTRALSAPRSRRGAGRAARPRSTTGRAARASAPRCTLQPRMVAPRARAGRDRAAVHRRPGARRRSRRSLRKWSGCTIRAAG